MESDSRHSPRIYAVFANVTLLKAIISFFDLRSENVTMEK